MIVVDDRRFRRGSRNWRGPLRLFGARDRLRQNIARARDDTAGRGLGVRLALGDKSGELAGCSFDAGGCVTAETDDD